VGTGIEGFYGNGKLALSSELSFPSGVALESSNNLYIADTGNFMIRQYNPSSGQIVNVGLPHPDGPDRHRRSYTDYCHKVRSMFQHPRNSLQRSLEDKEILPAAWRHFTAGRNFIAIDVYVRAPTGDGKGSYSPEKSARPLIGV
jgi:hypothetical protein